MFTKYDYLWSIPVSDRQGVLCMCALVKCRLKLLIAAHGMFSINFGQHGLQETPMMLCLTILPVGVQHVIKVKGLSLLIGPFNRIDIH